MFLSNTIYSQENEISIFLNKILVSMFRYIQKIYMKPYLTSLDCSTDIASCYVFLSATDESNTLRKLGYMSLFAIILHKVT